MTTKDWESVLNVRLSDELKKFGLNCKPEVMHSGNLRIDVEVYIGPVVIAVEAEHGQSNSKKVEAIGDADNRLEQKLAQCAVAVCYPEGTTAESLPTTKLIWTVRDGNQDTADWTTGDIEQLASVIRLTPAQLGNPDAAAAVLSDSLDEAVRRLSEIEKQELARVLDLPRQTKNGKPTLQPWNAPAKRALLVVATAVMFHSRLDVHLREMRPEYDNRLDPPEPYVGDWPPTQAQICADDAAPSSAYLAAWNQILALDYKPIFETGRAALLACFTSPAFAAAVKDTAKAALAVAENIASLRHDLLGRIFHTVLDTARYDGSFYTTTPAATLLASLAITDDMCEWHDPTAIAKFRITDPACGTGTLLMAAAERIRELAPHTWDNEELAAALIEKSLTGYDVNLTATHMAATTLGLLSPTTRFRNLKIGRAFLGVDGDDKAYLGSLEFLDQQPKLMPWPNAAQPVSQIDSGLAIEQAEAADLVIMNPPFTRDSLRYDQFSLGHERKIKDREKELFDDKPTYLAGYSGAFLYLADFICKSDDSVIASVLPLTGATDRSGRGMRRYLAEKFHIETIITSHDPERIYFSENTSIGEFLLICRRWPQNLGPKPITQVVNLVRNPANPHTALSLAHSITMGNVEEQGYGTVQDWPESRVAEGDWGAVQFLSPYLSDQFAALKDADLFPSIYLGMLAKIGPAGQRIRDAFRKSDVPSKEGTVALWDHKTDVIQRMVASADSDIAVKAGKQKLATRYWDQRSRFLLPNRMRLNTVRSLCVRVDRSVVGSSWSPCNFSGDESTKEMLEKACCVYLNSTIGVLAFLGSRSNKIPSYPRFSLDDLRNLPIPNFSALGEKAIERLASAYDLNSTSTMLPIPQMNQCPVRKALDDAVGKALGLDKEMVATIRRQLSMEPSITSKRYAGPGG